MFLRANSLTLLSPDWFRGDCEQRCVVVEITLLFVIGVRFGDFQLWGILSAQYCRNGKHACIARSSSLVCVSLAVSYGSKLLPTPTIAASGPTQFCLRAKVQDLVRFNPHHTDCFGICLPH